MRLLGLLSIGVALLASLLPSVDAHARLTAPATRPYTYSGGSNAPAWTCAGPVFGTSATSMRCHDVTQSSTITTVTAGSEIDMQWIMEAAHPGDCSVWLSYDADKTNPVNWIKIKDFPGCLAPDGLAPPNGNVKVRIPANLPSCDHCVLRWEWYAVQQVSNVEFYVNCADIKIVGGNDACPTPGPTTAIAGIDHLKTNFHTGYTGADKTGCPFYNPYNGGFNQLRSRGALEWVPPTTCSGGGGGGGGGATTAPTSAPAVTTAAPAGTTSPPATGGSGTGGKGGVVNSAGAKWDGSFSKWTPNDNSFCQCTFGGQCSYTCAGGGDAGQGGNCNPVACSTGQYSFSATDGWTIKTNKGGNPQRAFGYARICGDNPLPTCLAVGDVITFSFRFDNVKTWGGYIKIFFFGDGQNVLGLWPNKGMKLVAWPNGDLPQQWQADLTMLEGVWYDVTLTINNFNGGINMAIRENGATLYSGGGWNNNNVRAQDRPQVGVYTWAPDGPQFSIKLRNLCAGTSTQCKFNYDAAPTPTCPVDGVWPATPAGVQVARACPVDSSGKNTGFNMQRTCGSDGQWGAVDSSNCMAAAPVTTTPAPTTNLCANVNCGANGVCSQSTGKCICSNGYSGTLCQTAPSSGSTTCSVNCAALNRSPCLSNNVCGGCMNGYTSSSSTTNSLCTAVCSANCDSLNRLSCQTPGSCGACKSSFIEPSSQSRSDACTPMSDSTDGSASNQYSVMVQWKTGFCGSMKVKCPFNGKISLVAPAASTITSTWTVLNIQKAGTVVTASCPSWAANTYFDAGFCATKSPTDIISSTTLGFKTGTGIQTTKVLDYEPLSVSLTLALNGATEATVTPTFVTASAQQIAQSLNIDSDAVALQSFSQSNAKLYLTYKVSASNPVERNAALDNQLTSVGAFTVAPDESSVVIIAEEAGTGTSGAISFVASPFIIVASFIAAFFAYRL